MGIDPAIKAPFTAVVHTAAAEAALHDVDSRVHYEVAPSRGLKLWGRCG